MLSWDKKGIALNPASQVHYIDHLAVIAIIMGIPLLFLEDEDLHIGLHYYPELQAFKQDYDEFSPEFLIANYDVSFMTDLWDRRTIREKFADLEKKYRKTWRNVHCPHGFSDKGFYLEKSAMEDIVLLYGDNMIDQLHHRGVWDRINKYVISGNYRYTYFKKHYSFYEKIFQEEIQSKFDKKRPLILYAPTWLDLEESTTFFDAYSFILDDLPEDYNIIVKLHPRLELDDTASYYRIVGRYKGRNNILFLKNFPLVFPLLAHTDFYIGDMSSIGYDYLIFDKPLFLLNKQNRNAKTDRGLYLFRCGTEIKPRQYPDLYKIIEHVLPSDAEKYSRIRKQVWDYTFGEERPFEEIREDIIRCFDS